MPLPKLPTKPAALLSSTAIEQVNKLKVRSKPAAKTPTQNPATRREHVAPSAPVVARANATDSPHAPASPVLSVVPINQPVPRRRLPGSEPAKLFVLDTNVLMHDPTSLFRFEEHDVYLPMMTLAELDDNKKGMSEVARNARQVSRSLDSLIANTRDDDIEDGIELA